MTKEELKQYCQDFEDAKAEIDMSVMDYELLDNFKVQADIARQLTIANELKKQENEYLDDIGQSLEGIIGTMGDWLIPIGVYEAPKPADAIGKDETDNPNAGGING